MIKPPAQADSNRIYSFRANDNTRTIIMTRFLDTNPLFRRLKGLYGNVEWHPHLPKWRWNPGTVPSRQWRYQGLWQRQDNDTTLRECLRESADSVRAGVGACEPPLFVFDLKKVWADFSVFLRWFSLIRLTVFLLTTSTCFCAPQKVDVFSFISLDILNLTSVLLNYSSMPIYQNLKYQKTPREAKWIKKNLSHRLFLWCYKTVLRSQPL